MCVTTAENIWNVKNIQSETFIFVCMHTRGLGRHYIEQHGEIDGKEIVGRYESIRGQVEYFQAEKVHLKRHRAKDDQKMARAVDGLTEASQQAHYIVSNWPIVVVNGEF